MSLPTLPTGGYDRADGVRVLPNQVNGNFPVGKVGTPDPINGIQVFSSNGAGNYSVEQDPEYPMMERAEQATFQQRLKMSFAQAYECISYLPRGSFFRDSSTNVWRLLSSKIQAMRGGMASLEYTAESISFDTPPDEFQIVPVELGIDILKHPRYAWAISPQAGVATPIIIGDVTVDASEFKNTIMRMIQSYRDSPFYPSADNINGLIQNNIVSQIQSGKLTINYPNDDFDPKAKSTAPKNWDGITANKPSGNMPYYLLGYSVDLTDPDDPVAIALAAAKEIISKLWRQEDTPYQVGYELTWSQYFFAPPYLNPGGYRENPLDVVPDYFTDPNAFQGLLARGSLGTNSNDDTIEAGFQDAGLGGGSIFDYLAVINPQSYSSDRTITGDVNLSALRMADEVEYSRTWYKLIHRWKIAPIGQWDKQLYLEKGEDGPQNANDFVTTV
jgi:hypothetical protein